MRLLEKMAALNEGVQLYPHQQRVVDKDGSAIVIAHSVGGGKTLSGIARFERMKEEGKANKALVVVPAGLRNNFGESGVGKFTDSSYNIVGNGQERQKKQFGGIDANADYNIVSYDMFRRDPDRYLKESGADTLLLDESHRAKNEGTKTTDSLKNISRRVDNVISLTGSVISNSIADVQPLVDVVTAGQHGLGESKKDFEKRYLNRSDARKYQGIAENRKPVVGFRRERQLRQELSDVVDYVDYEDIKALANMPDKTIQVERVPMSSEQAAAYRKMVRNDKKLRELVTNRRLETLKDEEAAKAFSTLMESRKLMNSMATVDPRMTMAQSAQETPKTRRLLDDMYAHLENTPDGQAVLFSHLIHGGHDVLEADLQERGISYGKFLGKGNAGITEESRQQDVRDFNNRDKRVLLVSAAGGEGVSLNDTTWEGVLDPHYNPEKMNQMEARGVRSGGLSHRPEEERVVEINRYLATMPKRFGLFPSGTKTPDEVIYEIAKNKDEQNSLLFKMLKDEQKRRE